MISKIVITINAVIFALLIPYLEINITHVFNPDWSGHARLHEVWQLLTNAAFATMATWLAWRDRQTIMAFVLILTLNGAFIVAYFIKDAYGGSMIHSDGSELLVYGINPAVGLLVVLSIILSTQLTLELRRMLK